MFIPDPRIALMSAAFGAVVSLIKTCITMGIDQYNHWRRKEEFANEAEKDLQERDRVLAQLKETLAEDAKLSATALALDTQVAATHTEVMLERTALEAAERQHEILSAVHRQTLRELRTGQAGPALTVVYGSSKNKAGNSDDSEEKTAEARRSARVERRLARRPRTLSNTSS